MHAHADAYTDTDINADTDTETETDTQTHRLSIDSLLCTHVNVAKTCWNTLKKTQHW